MPLDDTRPGRTAKPENLTVALDYAGDGFVVFPCNPATKAPLTKNGFKDASTDAHQIKRWWADHPDAMPGLPCKPNGFAAVDLDVSDTKDGIEAAEALGITPDTASVVVRTPSGGLHLIYARPYFDTEQRGKYGIDIRDAGYIIAPGATGKRGTYTVERGDLWTACALGELKPFPKGLARPERDKDAEPAKAGDYRVADLWGPLAAISSDLPYEEWREVLMAIHHATGGSKAGLKLAYEWSAKDYPADRQEVRDKWRSFNRTTGDLITAETLFAKARAAVDLSDRFDDLEDDEPEDDDPFGLDEFLGLNRASKYGRLTVMSPGECAALPAQDYVVKNLIAPGQVGCIFGEPGAGKSVLAPYLGYRVAHGDEFFGQRTKGGTVFYAAAEDERGMAARVAALDAELGREDRFRLFGGVSDLFSKGEDKKAAPQLRDLLRAVKAERPKLVVIDTLAMAMPGLEENDAAGMNRVVRIGRALAKRGAAVIFVHHGTKAEGDTPRGHSVFNGALDFSILVKPADQNGIARAVIKKNRNGSPDQDIAFKIRAENVGLDVDGDPVTAPICRPVDGVANQPKVKLTKAQDAALTHLHQLTGDELVPVSERAWRDACVNDLKVSNADKDSSRLKAFKRASQELCRKELVAFADGHFWIVNPVELEFDDD